MEAHSRSPRGARPRVPASIDPKALTLEFMAPAEFKAAFVNRADREFVEVEVLDPDTPPVPGQPPPTKTELKIIKRHSPRNS
jgi:hypothetical protein